MTAIGIVLLILIMVVTSIFFVHKYLYDERYFTIVNIITVFVFIIPELLILIYIRTY